MSDIDNVFDGTLITSYLFDKFDEDSDDDITNDLDNVLRHIYWTNTLRGKWETELRFKHVKLHNALEHINDTTVLNSSEKQYVLNVLQNEIETEPRDIIECRMCNCYVNKRNTIIQVCRHRFRSTNEADWIVASSDEE